MNRLELNRLGMGRLVRTTLIAAGVAAAAAAAGLVRLPDIPHLALLAIGAWLLVSLPIGVLIGFSCSLGGRTR